jgi:hypothetical protein
MQAFDLGKAASKSRVMFYQKRKEKKIRAL